MEGENRVTREAVRLAAGQSQWLHQSGRVCVCASRCSWSRCWCYCYCCFIRCTFLPIVILLLHAYTQLPVAVSPCVPFPSQWCALGVLSPRHIARYLPTLHTCTLLPILSPSCVFLMYYSSPSYLHHVTFTPGVLLIFLSFEVLILAFLLHRALLLFHTYFLYPYSSKGVIPCTPYLPLLNSKLLSPPNLD